MTSQPDLDQGETSREWDKLYLGPSVGWVWVPNRNLLEVTVGGNYTLDPSTNLVHVNVNAAVTINLPPASNPTVPAGVLPGRFGKPGIAIVDIGGFAAGQPITINPKAGETIMGLASIQISSNNAGFILYPSNTLRGWTNQS